MNDATTCITDIIEQFGLPDKVKHIQENYKNLVVPYPTRKDHMVDILTSWSLNDFLDVCMTFSPVNNMAKILGLTLEEGYVHLTELLREAGMSEEDMKSVYTWSQKCALVTACKA
jgi:hypothetical protein